MYYTSHIQNLYVIIVTVVISSTLFHQTVAQYYNEVQCRQQCLRQAHQFKHYYFYKPYLSFCFDDCHQYYSFYQWVTEAPYRPTTAPRPTKASYYTLQTQSCGVQNAPKTRVVGGYDVNDCEYPWMVAVTIGDFFCGGTIIDSRHIVTAAHCLKDKDTNEIAPAYEVKVKLGSVKLSALKSYNVQQVIVDRRYVPKNLDYDVAILRLYDDLVFNDCLYPICLPQVWQDPSKAEYCTAAGWGVENYNSKSLSHTLKQVLLPIVNNSLCMESYGSHYVNSLKICAGNYQKGGIDTCQSDSGGPLMCKYGNNFVLMGIVSFGLECAKPRYPGIYTRVSHEAILSFIKQNSFGY